MGGAIQSVPVHNRGWGSDGGRGFGYYGSDLFLFTGYVGMIVAGHGICNLHILYRSSCQILTGCLGHFHFCFGMVIAIIFSFITRPISPTIPGIIYYTFCSVLVQIIGPANC